MRFQNFVQNLGEEVSLKRSPDDLEHNILISGLDHSKHGTYTVIKDDQALKVQYQIAALMPSNENHAKTAPIGNTKFQI